MVSKLEKYLKPFLVQPGVVLFVKRPMIGALLSFLEPNYSSLRVKANRKFEAKLCYGSLKKKR